MPQADYDTKARFMREDYVWLEGGLCQKAPEAFFPNRGGSARMAKAICRQCPIRAACLQGALDRHEQHGIWGGYSPRQRDRIRAGRTQAA